MGQDITVLVVDDTASARRTLRAHLSHPGYEVVEATTGREALELLESVKPDVILLDVMMPEMDGFETCSHIKADPRFEPIPVVMCTALNSQEDRNAGLRVGADEFLTKPVNGTELRLRVKALAKVKAYHDLLANVLPTTIARRLREERGVVADEVQGATILFSDIKGFVSFAKGRSAAEVVRILNEIFTAFDRRTKELGLEKIKTIGDAYMVAGGLDSGADTVEATVQMVTLALELFELLDGVCADQGVDLSLRVGVHCGPLIGGVIGTSRLAYDVWGDTVNIASRMESHGLVGHIQLSEAAHARIVGRWPFERRDAVAVKGQGEMTTWIMKVR
jgi:DNA-binding response OmpR family regulator